MNNINRKIDHWKKNVSNISLKKELDDSNEDNLISMFEDNIDFGTGGMRGIMGVGTNRINEYTITRVTIALIKYLKSLDSVKTLKVAIAYDTRYLSGYFAELAARLLASYNVKVVIFKEVIPTPILSYSVREMNCNAGIVITASHNSKEYNGYKVYDNYGCQITDKVCKEISSIMNNLDYFGYDIESLDYYIKERKIKYVEDTIIKSYIKKISTTLFYLNEQSKLKIAYTPLHGTGYKYLPMILHLNGFTNINIVSSQEEPDSEFTTCNYPNPEDINAMSIGIEYMKKHNCDILLATDPDCDRVGVAVRNKDNYAMLNGNEIGILLFNYICESRILLNKMPRNPIVIKTIVTTDLITKIADNYGVEVINLLTGFKYIGEYMSKLEKNNKLDNFILGLEESCGYLTSDIVRDKDAINGALLICEMTEYYRKQGKSLVQILDEIYFKFGYSYEKMDTYKYKSDEINKLMKITDNIELFNISNIFKREELIVVNYNEEQVQKYNSGSIKLPKSNVIKLIYKKNISITIRPSGTEPKLKIYYSIRAKNYYEGNEIYLRIKYKLEEILYNNV